MHGGGSRWGKIHTDRRAGQAKDVASRVRREAAAWTARAQDLEVLVYELVDQADPADVEGRPAAAVVVAAERS